MPSILSKLTPAWTWLQSLPLPPILNHPSLSRTPTTTTLLALTLPPTLLLTTLLPRILRSYRTYLSIGPGGMPHNFFGYLLQSALRLIARTDMRAADPGPYYSRNGNSTSTINPTIAARYAPYGETSFLGTETELPERTPPRPEVPYFVAPQRQISMRGSPDMVARMEGFMQDLVEANQGVLEIRPSGLEGVGTAAVWLGSGPGSGVEVPSFMGMVKGEIVHVHGEGSSHVTLSLVDAERAVRRGWAERHPISGVVMPWGYVMLYAPRDDAEFEVWKRLVVAGCRFVSGGKELKEVTQSGSA